MSTRGSASQQARPTTAKEIGYWRIQLETREKVMPALYLDHEVAHYHSSRNESYSSLPLPGFLRAALIASSPAYDSRCSTNGFSGGLPFQVKLITKDSVGPVISSTNPDVCRSLYFLG